MRFHFVTVPIHGSDTAEEELNRFLTSHRVVSVDRQLVPDGSRSTWAVCVTYVDADKAPGLDADGKASRVDYRALLPDAEFQVFAKVRDLRKRMAEQEGVPPHALFNNEQLADMDLAKLDGVGPARLEKYGRPFLDLLGTALPPAVPVALAASTAPPKAK